MGEPAFGNVAPEATTAFGVITQEDLEREPSPEEVEELEVFEEKKVEGVNSPFLNFLNNMAQGGGRQRRQNASEDPWVKDGMLYGQNFEELREAALDAGELFTDPEFPPDDESLYFSKSPPFMFEWKRASELSDDPHLFEGGASRFDVNQVRRMKIRLVDRMP